MSASQRQMLSDLIVVLEFLSATKTLPPRARAAMDRLKERAADVHTIAEPNSNRKENP